MEQDHLKIVETGHVEGNEASKKANQKHGFEPTGSYEHQLQDGSYVRIYQYELFL